MRYRTMAKTIAAAALLGTAAFYQGVVIRGYAVRTRKWGYGRSLRLAVVADLHSGAFGGGQLELLCPLRRLRPDFILLPGDIVDDRRKPRPAWEFLCGASSIAPCCMSLGNHEYRIRDTGKLKRRIARCGVRVLEDEALLFNTQAGPLYLGGAGDPEKTRRQDRNYGFNKAARGAFTDAVDSDAYTVLMAHRPDQWRLYARLGFDMALSGHAHGGQVRLPGINGLFAPNQGLFPQWAGGLYRHGGLAHVVSRGLAVFPEIPRGFNPPEIVTIEIVGAG